MPQLKKTPINFLTRRKQTIETSCGIAFDAETNEVVVAERAPKSVGGFHIWSVPHDENRALNIIATEVRTAITGRSAHTERYPQFETDGLDEQALLGTLAHSIEHNPHREEMSFAWGRTPDGVVAITQADARDVAHTTEQTTHWLQRQKLPHWRTTQRLRIETQTRAIARLWLSENAAAHAQEATETIAFLTVGREGYAVGLWNTLTGLAYETEEQFEPDASPEMATAHTCESLVKLIDPSNLARLSLGAVSVVVVSIVRSLDEMLFARLGEELRELGDHITLERVQFSGAVNAPAAETTETGEIGCRSTYINQATALALGALLDSPQVPLIDLAHDLTAEYKKLLEIKELSERLVAQTKANIAKAAIFAPLVLGLSVLCASYLDLSFQSSKLQQQTAAEQKRAKTLAAEAALRVAAKQQFAEYVALTDQTLELRRRQPASAQLLNDLNQQWPGNDPSWFISEMKSTAGGALEFKGRTKKEEAVTAFTHGLEFSNGLFVNVSNSIQSTTGNAATPSASENAAAPSLDFIVRAAYTPLQSAPVVQPVSGGAR